MPDPVLVTLELLRDELDAADAERHEYVLFGSAVLFLHRLRETVGDVDVFVSRRVWAEWFTTGGWRICTPRAHDPAFLELAVPGGVEIHAFYDWTVRDVDWIRAADCFEQAESVPYGLIDIWQCAPLSLIRAHKVGAYTANPDSRIHAKHLADVRAIDERSAAA